MFDNKKHIYVFDNKNILMCLTTKTYLCVWQQKHISVLTTKTYFCFDNKNIFLCLTTEHTCTWKQKQINSFHLGLHTLLSNKIWLCAKQSTGNSSLLLTWNSTPSFGLNNKTTPNTCMRFYFHCRNSKSVNVNTFQFRSTPPKTRKDIIFQI